MPLELDQNQSKYQIRSFKPGAIKINDKIYNHSLIIAPDQLIENWSPENISELTSDLLLPILNLKPDILLIGTGSKHELLPVEIYGNLINAGIGVEVMATDAACRTFNALSSENRNVVAALIIR